MDSLCLQHDEAVHGVKTYELLENVNELVGKDIFWSINDLHFVVLRPINN